MGKEIPIFFPDREGEEEEKMGEEKEKVQKLQELQELLEKIETAEQRLGGVQANVLALAELKEKSERIYLDFYESKQMYKKHQQYMEELLEKEECSAKRLERLEALESRLGSVMEAADRIAAVAESLPDLEDRVCGLTASESAAQQLLSELKRAEKAAKARASELEDLDRRLAERTEELGKVETSVQSILDAVDALRSARDTCGDLEGRVKRIQEAEGRLIQALNARETRHADGRERRRRLI